MNRIAKHAYAMHREIDYRVRFRIRHRVEFGESVIVLGSIPALDKWKK
jgi:hypothetical protein